MIIFTMKNYFYKKRFIRRRNAIAKTSNSDVKNLSDLRVLRYN